MFALVFLFQKLLDHVGHELSCVAYTDKETGKVFNISIECVICNEIIISRDLDLIEG